MFVAVLGLNKTCARASSFSCLKVNSAESEYSESYPFVRHTTATLQMQSEPSDVLTPTEEKEEEGERGIVSLSVR